MPDSQLNPSGGLTVRVLIVLALGQIIGWGTVSLPAVIGDRIALELGLSVASIFGGLTVFYTALGFVSPLLARPFARWGARRLMIMGTVATVPGFLVLAASRDALAYFGAWAILGFAGSATLTTSANIMLNEIFGRSARIAIGGLMLMTGLSFSIFWPITALLTDEFGWRSVCGIYAATALFFCLPLYVFGLPSISQAPRQNEGREAVTSAPCNKSVFYLLATGVAINAFVTLGFNSILIELLKSRGLPPGHALAYGSLLGLFQVSARAVDFFGGKRWDGITTGIFAGSTLFAAMVLMMANTSTAGALGFVVLYGLGSGASAVSRASMPLVFYDKVDFARVASQIAMPINILSALSPPLLAGLLSHGGGIAALSIGLFSSALFVLLLFMLRRHRP